MEEESLKLRVLEELLGQYQEKLSYYKQRVREIESLIHDEKISLLANRKKYTVDQIEISDGKMTLKYGDKSFDIIAKILREQGPLHYREIAKDLGFDNMLVGATLARFAKQKHFVKRVGKGFYAPIDAELGVTLQKIEAQAGASALHLHDRIVQYILQQNSVVSTKMLSRHFNMDSKNITISLTRILKNPSSPIKRIKKGFYIAK